MASARVQRCALILSAYDHKVQYVPGKEHTNADLLSWLPLPEEPKEIPMPEETVLLLQLWSFPQLPWNKSKLAWSSTVHSMQVC